MLRFHSLSRSTLLSEKCHGRVFTPGTTLSSFLVMHFEVAEPYLKADSVTQWGTVLQNSAPIRFEMTELWTSSEAVTPTRTTTTMCIATGDHFLI